MTFLQPKLGIPTPYKPQGDIQFESSTVVHDRIKFHVLKSVPSAAPKGKILFVHGWCEHTQMYQRIMEYMSRLGFECLVFDQRGSGMTSLGKYRGRCGRNAAAVYKDIDLMIETLTPKDTDAPLYLIGHSAGGGIVLNYILQGHYKHRIAGVVTTGPLIRIADRLAPPPIVEYVLTVLASWFPYMQWGAINTDPTVRSVITKADEWVDYLQQELMTQGNTTLGQIKFMFERGHSLSAFTPEYIQENIDPKLRLLTIHCTDDPMTSYRHSKEFFDKLPLADKRFVSFEKDTHSLFIDTEETFQETCDAIAGFLGVT